MQKIIKKIRTYMNISQKEFAEKIGVTASTVNRWEKGVEPQFLTQMRFEKFCNERGINFEEGNNV